MGVPKNQPSFNSGEWAPSLYSRVDLEKYKSGAALLRNFFVDYRGGASTRPGTRYVLQAYKSATDVQLIPFQASLDACFILEVGNYYIRFHRNGSPVLETGLSITDATKANPCVVSVTNSYSVGDWVYISGVNGMTQLNGHYFVISARSSGTITLEDLFGNPVNSSTYGTWTSGGTVQRVYTLAAPYAAADVAAIKYAQNVAELIFCNPNYVPYKLVYTTKTNWSITPITFGASISTPASVSVSSTLAAGSTNYSYVVTAVNEDGDESATSSAATLLNKADLRTTVGTNIITWSAVSGAVSYNVYKSDVSINNPVPVGMPHGFIGNVTGTTLADSNISADFSQGPPIIKDPFIAGSGVASVTITSTGSYTTAPTVTFSAPAYGSTAVGIPLLSAIGVSINFVGSRYTVGRLITFANGIILRVTSVNTAGSIISVVIQSAGSVSVLPTNPITDPNPPGEPKNPASFNLTYGVTGVNISYPGSGYLSAPTVTFSAGLAAGTAALGNSNAGNPTLPAFFQQRLMLAAQPTAPQTMRFSQPGNYYNYNISSPVVDSDAITATLSAGILNTIRSAVPQSGGLIVFTDSASWLVNGGSQGSAITPTAIVANTQSYDGANDLPPIVANYDILYVSSKGSTVRDATYNFYTNVFTGMDISAIASHLFFGYTIDRWAWAQEPYKIAWLVRSDGTLLSLTFIKDQEFIAWAHSDTLGSFKSVASIVESTDVGYVNAVYVVVERTVRGQAVKYIERFAERYFPNGVEDAWCVDAGIRYSGTPAMTFSGGEHLAGLTVTGVADGEVIEPFVMPNDGNFSLTSPASKVLVGLGFTAQLKTLPLDLGEPTVQGKPKKINAVTLAVVESLGLKIGSDFDHLVDVKDLQVGNINTMAIGQGTQQVSNLWSGYARQNLDPTYTVPGQYCIQQDLPLPATITAVIPQITLGEQNESVRGRS